MGADLCSADEPVGVSHQKSLIRVTQKQEQREEQNSEIETLRAGDFWGGSVKPDGTKHRKVRRMRLCPR